MFFESLHGVRLCRWPVYQRDASSIAAAIEHSLESQAQRAELPKLRLRVKDKVGRILIDDWPQLVDVLSCDDEHEIANVLEHLYRSGQETSPSILQ